MGVTANTSWKGYQGNHSNSPRRSDQTVCTIPWQHLLELYAPQGVHFPHGHNWGHFNIFGGPSEGCNSSILWVNAMRCEIRSWNINNPQGGKKCKEDALYHPAQVAEVGDATSAIAFEFKLWHHTLTFVVFVVGKIPFNTLVAIKRYLNWGPESAWPCHGPFKG